MALLLRVDIDKPFGHHTFLRKVFSKLKEDYPFPQWFKMGYLSHFKEFLNYCNKNSVRGHMYHRMCTLPDAETVKLLKSGNHHYGLHTENTRNEDTFGSELKAFKKQSQGLEVESFSKHGSGVHKLGRYHYAPYEPEKYKQWAVKFNLLYPFGNGIAESPKDLIAESGWFANHFWLEHPYRHKAFNTIAQLLDFAQNNDAVVIIHPSNYKTDSKIMSDFKELVNEAKKRSIEWKLIGEDK